MKRTDVAYYDHVFGLPQWSQPATKLPWLPLWRFVAGQLLPDDVVLDLGCGPAHLTELIDVRRYVGVDFSSRAIELARARAPEVDFVVGALPDCVAACVSDYRPTVVVLSETLEHLTHDRETLEALPAGMRIVATVPAVDDPSHVRVFSSADAVHRRYDDLVDVRVTSIPPWWWGLAGSRI